MKISGNWLFLEKGDVIEKGDQVFFKGWKKAKGIGNEVEGVDFSFRRKLPTRAQEIQKDFNAAIILINVRLINFYSNHRAAFSKKKKCWLNPIQWSLAIDSASLPYGHFISPDEDLKTEIWNIYNRLVEFSVPAQTPYLVKKLRVNESATGLEVYTRIAKKDKYGRLCVSNS